MNNAFDEHNIEETPFKLHYLGDGTEEKEYNISEFENPDIDNLEATVKSAFLAGNKDENSLTNIIFFQRHPERNKQPLKSNETEQIKEWKKIRDELVRPTIIELRSKSTIPPTTQTTQTTTTQNTGQVEATVKSAFLAGNKDENSLTNIIFFQRHPELNKNERLKPHQRELMEEWLYILKNIVRRSIIELKSTGTKPSQSVKIGDYMPKPLKLPPNRPLEFAPKPTGIAYWPVISKDKDWHVVSYKYGPNRGDVIRGRNTEREFGASRGDRIHGAHDFYGRAGELVVSIEDGIFLYTIENFLGNTSAMYIQHTIENPRIIVVYGEIKRKSWEDYNLKIGDSVKAGQIIAELGITPSGHSMLHFETHALGLKGIPNKLSANFRSWKKGGEPPRFLLNPTEYLLAVREQELERRKNNGPPLAYKSKFNESLVPDRIEQVADQTEHFLFPDILGKLGSLDFNRARDYATISTAFLAGNKDENSLTNIIFFQRHPERNKQPLKSNETEQIKEWKKIRDELVRPTIIELRSKSTIPPTTQTTTTMPKSLPQALKELPLIIAGPIVRQVTTNAIWLWIAVKEKIKNISTRVIIFNSDGQSLREISVQTTKDVVRLGENLWILLLKVTPLSEQEFLTDFPLGYDLDLVTETNGVENHHLLSKLGLEINYPPFSLPTVIVGNTNTSIAHGSCRRPGSSILERNLILPDKFHHETTIDAFKPFDSWMSKNAKKTIFIPFQDIRPASLILTGDQIYADDVSIQLFRAIRKIVDDIFGYDEVLPSLGAGFPVRAADFTAWRNQDGAPYWDWSDRRKLTHRLTSKIGFTTEDGEAHLLSFSEYAAMYLIVWGSEVCKKYLEPGTDKTLENYHEAVKACRRVMANIAVYMLFDDHEITDDWNLSEEWIQKTKSNVMAKRIISNGLAAYWAFQGWGNDPNSFDEYFKKNISLHLENMLTNNGSSQKTVDSYENTLLGKHWSFLAEANPKALCVDTRTLRTFMPDSKAVLSGKPVWEYFSNYLLKKKYKFDNEIMLIVTPPPFFPHRFWLRGQEHKYTFPKDKYVGDFESYATAAGQRADFIRWIKKTFNPYAVVFFSGDVHFGSVVSGIYQFGKSADEIRRGKNILWTLPVIQITSSPIKNVSSNFVSDVKLPYLKVGVPGVEADTIAEHTVSKYEVQQATYPDGAIVVKANIEYPDSGNLGKNTVIFENNISVVNFPYKSKNGVVKSTFIGMKKSAIEQFNKSLDIDKVKNHKYLDPKYWMFQ